MLNFSTNPFIQRIFSAKLYVNGWHLQAEGLKEGVVPLEQIVDDLCVIAHGIRLFYL